MTAEIAVHLGDEPLLHYAQRQDVVFWTLRPCAQDTAGDEERIL
jgi:hypothetical protein